MRRYIIIIMVSVLILTGCGQPPEPESFTESIYWNMREGKED
nr:MAG TPA: TRAF PROTEIN, TRAO PROTEIN, TRAN ADHESION, BACTERIAL SECRETION.5A [Caudoviricetes sp.]